jgi:hypothetical protein
VRTYRGERPRRERIRPRSAGIEKKKIIQPGPERLDRVKSQSAMCTSTGAPKISAHDAAFLRKLGIYIDPIEVKGEDIGLLSKQDAQMLRESGMLVLDEEIDPNS